MGRLGGVECANGVLKVVQHESRGFKIVWLPMSTIWWSGAIPKVEDINNLKPRAGELLRDMADRPERHMGRGDQPHGCIESYKSNGQDDLASTLSPVSRSPVWLRRHCQLG
jgi:hypothetical protein